MPVLMLAARSAPAQGTVPLVVDLDGTLLRTDTLLESLLLLAHRRPLALLLLPWWLARGRARFKQWLAQQVPLDLHALPVAPELLQHLRAQQRRGRRLVLATGADARVARAAAAEFGLFDRVLASDGATNLSGAAKRDRLVAEFGERGFDYVGSGVQDLPVWRAARRGIVVAPTRRLAAAAARATSIERSFGGGRPALRDYLGAMRAPHWLKNLLVLVPLLAAQRWQDGALRADALLALACFCLVASGAYLLNDLLDLGADRRHPHKRQRALASGRLPVGQALLLVPALWLAAAACASWLGPLFLGVLAAYALLTLAYSLRLKDFAYVDAIALAGGYTLRVVGGAVAADIAVSPWLLACSMTLFFGLALLKRAAELSALRAWHGPQARARGYGPGDVRRVVTLGIAACALATLLLAAYPWLARREALAAPVLLLSGVMSLWAGRLWRAAVAGRIPDDPVAFALRDPASRGFGVLALGLLAWMA